MDFISSEDKSGDAKNKTHFAVVMEYMPHTLEDVMRKGVLSSKQGPEVIKEIMRQLVNHSQGYQAKQHLDLDEKAKHGHLPI